MGPAINPFEQSSNDTPMTPVSTRSYPRQTSSLTLPLAGMETLSRTTTVAGTPVADTDTETPNSHHPFSPFYSHPQCAVSSEQSRVFHSKERRSTTSFDRDIEKGMVACPPHAMLTPQASGRPSFEPSLATTQTNVSLSTPVKMTSSCSKARDYVSVWPAGSEVRQRKKDAQRMKGCLLFRSLSRKQKIIAKICLAILILGVATAIGCAISYKTGGLVWKSANNYGAIGS